MIFKEKYDRLMNMVNTFLEKTVAAREGIESTIYKAMNYSVVAGGKRLRPVLVLATAELLGVDTELMLPFAAALEMIHTYSLIHDDLPAMDNDDYRRGKLTNHKVFGEAMAILAGDALLNKAFEMMLEDMSSEVDGELLKKKVMAARVIAYASGTEGMVGGQVVDLESEGKAISAETLLYMHRKKTGALIRASIIAPAMLANIDDHKLNALEEYAESIGLAFQIKDDIMDVESTLEEMGKNSGRDQEKGKSTFVTVLGLEESKRKLNEVINKAIISLEPFGSDADFLIGLAGYIAKRSN